MFRLLLILAVLTSVLILAADQCCAQQTSNWPEFKPSPEPGTNFRGPGNYLHVLKIFACWLVFLLWVRTADWVSRDGQELRLHYLRWNPIVFGTFLAALVLFWLIPFFWVGFPLLAIACVGPLIAYLANRRSTVVEGQRELALENLCSLFALILVDLLHLAAFVGLLFLVVFLAALLVVAAGPIGILLIVAYPLAFVFGVLPQVHGRMSDWFTQRFAAMAGAEKIDPHEGGPPVILKASGGPSERDENVRLLSARQAPGFLDARVVIADGLSHRAHAIMLDYSQQGVGVHWMIDGVWHAGEAISREQGDPLLQALKLLSALNPQQRQEQQRGTFSTTYRSTEYEATLSCQGTKTGERAMIQFRDRKVAFENLDQIGMRPKMQEELQELLKLKQGMVLFSAMPGAGLRSTAHVVLRNTDRFTREFVAIEEDTKRYQEIENCPVTTYKAAEGQSPASVLPKLIRTLPDVIVVRDLVNAETVSMLCQEIPDGRLIISTVRAKDGPEALLRVLAMGVPAAEFAQAISAVLNQRLIRKLCQACKEAYVPTPQVLGQLGIPEGRVQAFFRPPQQPEQVCQECGGVGYKGRTAIFELLKVGGTVRKVLPSGPKLELLRQAARKDGMRGFQEEGTLLVAKGVTSLPELMRVIKE